MPAISGNSPVHPVSQVLLGAPGAAPIGFTVKADGTTDDFKVVKSDYVYFGVHAVIAVQAWRFGPAMKEGRPVDRRVQQTFQFSTR